MCYPSRFRKQNPYEYHSQSRVYLLPKHNNVMKVLFFPRPEETDHTGANWWSVVLVAETVFRGWIIQPGCGSAYRKHIVSTKRQKSLLCLACQMYPFACWYSDILCFGIESSSATGQGAVTTIKPFDWLQHFGPLTLTAVTLLMSV